MTGAWAYVEIGKRDLVGRLREKAPIAAAVSLGVCTICAYAYARHASNADTGIIGGSSARENPFLTMALSAARAALMASIILSPLWLQRLFANRPAARLAELSYGIYLIHLVVAWYVGLVWLDLPRDGSLKAALLWFGVVLPISIAYAWASRHFVELPVKRWVLSVRRGRAPALAPSQLQHSDA